MQIAKKEIFFREIDFSQKIFREIDFHEKKLKTITPDLDYRYRRRVTNQRGMTTTTTWRHTLSFFSVFSTSLTL